MGTFDRKIAVITGGANGIGRAIADAFLREGAVAHIIDLQRGDWFVGDVGDREPLERFAEDVIQKSGHVDYLINNALPLMIDGGMTRLMICHGDHGWHYDGRNG